MDLARVKREYGAQLCLWGNLNPAYLVEARDRSEIELEVNRILDAGAAGGGFIFGTSSGLFHEMKQENISWAYQTARRARTGSAFLKNQL
jgi:uroporphyrinogen decarboxylase